MFSDENILVTTSHRDRRSIFEKKKTKQITYFINKIHNNQMDNNKKFFKKNNNLIIIIK